jgi:hypothetical protein
MLCGLASVDLTLVLIAVEYKTDRRIALHKQRPRQCTSRDGVQLHKREEDLRKEKRGGRGGTRQCACAN